MHLKLYNLSCYKIQPTDSFYRTTTTSSLLINWLLQYFNFYTSCRYHPFKMYYNSIWRAARKLFQYKIQQTVIYFHNTKLFFLSRVDFCFPYISIRLLRKFENTSYPDLCKISYRNDVKLQTYVWIHNIHIDTAIATIHIPNYRLYIFFWDIKGILIMCVEWNKNKYFR